jgi:hypothetical protein
MRLDTNAGRRSPDDYAWAGNVIFPARVVVSAPDPDLNIIQQRLRTRTGSRDRSHFVM